LHSNRHNDGGSGSDHGEHIAIYHDMPGAVYIIYGIWGDELFLDARTYQRNDHRDPFGLYELYMHRIECHRLYGCSDD
jgi:hypothetical protein